MTLMPNDNLDGVDYWQEMPATRIGWELLKLEPHILEVGDIDIESLKISILKYSFSL